MSSKGIQLQFILPSHANITTITVSMDMTLEETHTFYTLLGVINRVALPERVACKFNSLAGFLDASDASVIRFSSKY